MSRVERPRVSVIMPFAGSGEDAAAAVAQLAGLTLRPGDEAIVVDNSAGAVVDPPEGVRAVRADEIASSYHARNTGARAAGGEWLLFVDSDCLLPADLIDHFFEPAPGERTGLVAGGIEGDPTQDSLIARYHRSRGHLDPEYPLRTGPSPAVGTANALVRRRAWEELGGFREVVSGADFEFSWRAGAAGWEAEHRPAATVLHRHPEALGAMLRKARRYGAGQRWLDSLHPGVPRKPGLVRELGRGIAGAAVWAVTLRGERSAFKLLDIAWISAYSAGWRTGSNEPKALAQAH